VEYGPVGCTLEALYANDGAVNPAMGARGGLAGAPSAQHVREATGELVDVDSWGPVRVEEGQRMVARTSGGGGYGSPLERPPDLVARDVAEGWISEERASTVYGVVLDRSGGIDAEATARRRGGDA
jgi:N-methylhydantoinase B